MRCVGDLFAVSPRLLQKVEKMKSVKHRILLSAMFALLFGSSSYAQLIRPMVGKDIEYVSKEGDSLLSIAEGHGVAIDHLAFANGYPITAYDIVPGTLLTIPGRRVLPANPPYHGLVLNIPERGLFYFKDGNFQDFIPASVGTPPKFPTPVGDYSVIEKVLDPWWYPPAWAEDRKPVPPGPENPLGDRWIGLSAPRVGIHGTDNPLNVGAQVTHGCIRLYPDEVRKLYPKVHVGMPIRIEYESAKLGRDQSGKVHLVNFPDVYKRSDPAERSAKLLTKIGKPSLLKNPRFMAKVELLLGTPLDTGVPVSKGLLNMR